MKKFLKKLIKLIMVLTAVPLLYILIAFFCSIITINRTLPLTTAMPKKMIYLHSNGVHLDIAIRATDASPQLLKDIHMHDNSQYLSFGWGDESFYLNTPTWNDLTLKTTINALLLDSPALMHLSHYQSLGSDWVSIPVSEQEFLQLNTYINESFTHDITGHKTMLINRGYGLNDDFYRADGSYTLLNTCNTWANRGFKRSGLKASYWTPFDFGLLNKYR